MAARLGWLACALIGLAGFAGCDQATGAKDATASGDLSAETDAQAGTDAAVLDLNVPETTVDCPGASGCLCSADNDCNSGICAETPEGRRCGVLCGAGCPTGTVCRTANTAGEPISYCAPVGVRQCAPCASTADCTGPWGAPAVCASAGDAGSFCASVCQVTADCPTGLQCVASVGLAVKVCAPPDGLATCSCSSWATAAGASTSCTVPEGTASCPGTRSCSATGLSECSKIQGEACVQLGCKDAKDGSPCDDGDPCTQSECQSGSCKVTDDNLCQCQQTADCPDDGNLCNGKPFCDKSSAPYSCKTNPATVVQCQKSDNPCVVSSCDAATGKCQTANAADQAACEDGKVCTTGDYCLSGQCTPGTVTCTCAADSDCLAYEDGNQCNGKLFCNKAKGQCQVNPATVVVCPTGLDSTCQQTICQPTTGACELTNAPTNTTCDDGNPCSASDHCDGGSCISTTDICPCQKDADCTAQEDNNLCNGTLYCDLATAQCKINPKTVVSCPSTDSTPCAPVECLPETGTCEPSPLLFGACDDGNPCTAPGTCSAGLCLQGPDICQCQGSGDCSVFDDGNPCNGTYYCDNQTGSCLANLAAVPVCPPTADACSLNVCDAASGGCKVVAAADGTQCQDGEACTKNDQCQSGACTAGFSVCACLADTDCAPLDDGDPCNGWWFCDKSDGAPKCAFTALAQPTCQDAATGDTSEPDGNTSEEADVSGGSDDTAVDDTVLEDTALADTVADGEGQSDDTPAVDVPEDTTQAEDGTDDVEVPITTPVCGDGTCELAEIGQCIDDCGCVGAADLAPCDDDNACTYSDQCAGETCVGQAKDCSDGWPQSLDQCEPTLGTCSQVWPEVCNGVDDDNNGQTDDVKCGTATCSCQSGVMVCTAGCSSCPDQGDLALTIDVGGTTKVVCAHDYPAWGITSDTPTGYQVLADQIVLDPATGLQWQQELAYNALDWPAAVAVCDGLTQGGHEDWRLPTIAELESLLDFKTNAMPPIDATTFPSTWQVTYWSATPYLQDYNYLWGVYFALGTSNAWPSTTSNAVVRCVRNAVAPKRLPVASRWQFQSQSAVALDQATGLVWQRQAPVLGGASNDGQMSQTEAVGYCGDLTLEGQSNWRLPSLRELRSITDFKRTTPPPFEPMVFTLPDIGSRLWTTAVVGDQASKAWTVSTYSGYLEQRSLLEAQRVLCVQDVCGDGTCGPDEESVCGLDCGCDGVSTPVPCDDGDACTTGETCSQGLCSLAAPTDCNDGDHYTSDSCDFSTGCKHTPKEVCNSIDDDGDGQTDTVSCNGGSCSCKNGVWICPVGCTTCPDYDDVAVAIDDDGTDKVVCAADQHVWGIVADAPATFVDLGNGVVSDSTTGLQWEQVASAFDWNVVDSISYCDGLTLAGKTDWRRPTVAEFESLLDLTKTAGPLLDEVKFPGACATCAYWTAVPYQPDPATFWVMSVENGLYGQMGPPQATQGRCVRNQAVPSKGARSALRWQVNAGGGMVEDLRTGLMWQRSVPTTGGNGSGLFNWAAADQYCKDLVLYGQSDWRLPGRRELSSIVDRKSAGPATADAYAFAETNLDTTSYYWTATPLGDGSAKMYAVDFATAMGDFLNKTGVARVRCVR